MLHLVGCPYYYYRSVFFDPGNSMDPHTTQASFSWIYQHLRLEKIKLLDFDVGTEGALVRKCQGINVLS